MADYRNQWNPWSTYEYHCCESGVNHAGMQLSGKPYASRNSPRSLPMHDITEADPGIWKGGGPHANAGG